eukprot:gene12623-15853_t
MAPGRVFLLAALLLAALPACMGISCYTTSRTYEYNCGDDCVQWTQIPDNRNGVNGNFDTCLSWDLAASVFLVDNNFNPQVLADITGKDGKGTEFNCSDLIAANGRPTSVATRLATNDYPDGLDAEYTSDFACCTTNYCNTNLTITLTGQFLGASPLLVNSMLATAALSMAYALIAF